MDDIEKEVARSGFMLSVASWLLLGRGQSEHGILTCSKYYLSQNNSLYQENKNGVLAQNNLTKHGILTCLNFVDSKLSKDIYGVPTLLESIKPSISLDVTLPSS